jgi:DnaJ homolog subfamily B member 4
MDYCAKNIEVAKGMNDGDVFMYRGEGHQQPGSVPGDIKVTFKLVEPTEVSKDFAVTSRYSRKGDDLFYKHPIKLENAIKCLPVKIPLLDGRLVHLALDEIVTPETVKEISSEGMKHWDKNDPLDKNAKTGTLYVSFDIQFPKTVST